jgi:hypothetical protein
MLRGGRDADIAVVGLSFVILFVGWLAVLSSNAAVHQSQSYSQHQCAREKADHSASFRAGELVRSAPTDQATGQQPRQHEQQTNWCDLAAQESMAQSTIGMERAAWATTVLSGVGILLLFGTLYFTFRASETADETLRQTKETNVNTREIGEAQVKAFVTPFDFGIGFQELHPVVRFRLKNNGNSPAIWTKATCRIVFSPLALDGSAQSTPITMLIGSLSPGEESGEILYDFNVVLTCHEDSRQRRMVIEAMIDLEWTNAFNRKDGAFYRYDVFLKDPLTEAREVSIVQSGSSLIRREFQV